MSKMQSIPIAEATEDQLREFAEVQQLDLSEVRDGDLAGLMAAISAAWPGDNILIVEPEADVFGQDGQQTPVSLVAQHRLTGGNGADDPKVLLKVGSTPYPGGNDPVPLGLNGSTVVLQRNMLTEVPYRYYLLLQDAVRGDVSPGPDDDLGRPSRENVETEYTNYPLAHVQLPPAAEIAAWHARVDNVNMPA